MKLKEHKIAIILGVVGLLIPLILFINKEFIVILILINPLTMELLLWGTSYLASNIFGILLILPFLSIILITCIAFGIHSFIIGFIIDLAIKYKKNRSVIILLLILSIIILHIIGYAMFQYLNMGNIFTY